MSNQEIVTYAFTDSQFSEFLASIKTDAKLSNNESFWNKLINIFNVKDMVDAVIFKNYDVGNVFLRYFYDMEIDFREIDRNCYVLNQQ